VHGLLPASHDGEKRYTIKCIHGAVGTNTDTILIQQWGTKTVDEAHEVLSKPDCVVTNLKDKEQLLPKLAKMNDTTTELFHSLDNRLVPWLEVKGGKTFEITAEATSLLSDKATKDQDPLLNTVAIIGKLRTGKSYLMNSLMEHEVFTVSSSASSCTQGVSDPIAVVRVLPSL